MSDLTVSLPSYFGYAGIKAVKERGNFLLASENAIIHKSNSNPHEIFARYNLHRQLENAGFPYTSGIISTVSGAPFVTLGRDIFVMTRHFPGREPDWGNLHDITLVIENLARFHSAARNFSVCPKIPSSPPLTEIFTKKIAAFNTAIKQLNRRQRLSDFDIRVLKHADFYLAHAENAVNILNQTDYASMYADALLNNHICHNALKEETFSIHKNICYISRFDEVSIDLQLTDIASVLRRYARKTAREIPITQLLKIYNNILPLSASAKKILFAQLSFPIPFFKIVAQYYSKKRNFIPAAITSRMTGILEEQENYDEFISFL